MVEREKDKTENAVVSGGIAKLSAWKRASRRTKIALVLVLLALIAAVLAVIYMPRPIEPPKIVDLDTFVSYESASREQVDYYLFTKTGLTLEYLQSKKTMDSNVLKNFDQAYQSAQALMAVGDTDRAFAAYAVAEKSVPADNYEFYMNYGNAYMKVGDKQKFREKLEQAKAIAAQLPASKADDPDDEVQSPLERVNERLKALDEDGTGE